MEVRLVRTVAALALAIAMFVGVCGCSKDDPTKPRPPAVDSPDLKIDEGEAFDPAAKPADKAAETPENKEK